MTYIFITALLMLHSGAESDVFNVSNMCLYGMIASSSLLISYIAVLLAFQVDLWARVLETWKRARGDPQSGEKRHLLHTLPYYLAMTRSSCEVILHFDVMEEFE